MTFELAHICKRSRSGHLINIVFYICADSFFMTSCKTTVKWNETNKEEVNEEPKTTVAK